MASEASTGDQAQLKQEARAASTTPASADGTREEKSRVLQDFIEEMKSSPNAIDEDLHGYCKTALGDWTRDDFATTGFKALDGLRTLMLTRGIYVPNYNTKGGNQYAAIVEAIAAEEPMPYKSREIAVRSAMRDGGTGMRTLNAALQRMIGPENVHKDYRLPPGALNLEQHQEVRQEPRSTVLQIPGTDFGSQSPRPGHRTTAYAGPQDDQFSTHAFIEDNYAYKRGPDRRYAASPAPARAYATVPGHSAPAQAFQDNAYGTAPAVTLPVRPQQPGTMHADAYALFTFPWAHPDEASSQKRTVDQIEKMFPDSEKYQGIGDALSLHYRATHFLRLCRRRQVADNYIARLLPTMMVRGEPYNYCDKLLDSHDDWRQILALMAAKFETMDIQRARENRWQDLTVQMVANEMPGKSLATVVRAFYTRAVDGAACFDYPSEAARDLAIQKKLIREFKAFAPTATLVIQADSMSRRGQYDAESIIKDVEEGVITLDRHQLVPRSSAFASEVLYADRTYRRGGRGFRPPARGGLGNKPARTGKPYRRIFKCYICKKEGCRYSNHTQEEKDAHSRAWQETTNGTPAQYMMAVESAEAGEEVEEAFALIVDDDEHDQDDDDDGTVEYTSFWAAAVEGPRGGDAVAYLAEHRNSHALGLAPHAHDTAYDDESDVFAEASQYDDTAFMGFIVDTGAAKASTCGRPQFEALQRIKTGLVMDESTANSVRIRFGIGQAASIGSAAVDTPIGTITFHVMPTTTPFLVGLKDLDDLHCYFDNTRNVMIFRRGTEEKLVAPVIRRFGHAFMTIPEMACGAAVTFFTSVELQRLHRRFGHPSVGRLYRLLKSAGNVDVDIKDLEDIRRFCHECQRHQGPPKRFKFNLRDEHDITFNGTVIVDVAYINGKPYIHVIDQATGFMAARWLNNMTAQHAWDKLRECWLDTYVGPPDLIVHDQGTNFAAQNFKDNAALMGTKTKGVPTEAHHSIGQVERYHGILKRAFEIICKEAPELDHSSALQMAVKAINDTAGPNGIVPTLLVFGAYPRTSAASAPALTVTARAAAIRAAMKDLERARARRQITEGLRMRNGPQTPKPRLTDWVLVWREAHGSGAQATPASWQGPFQIVNTNDETVTVDNGNGTTTDFRSTSVRLYDYPEANPPPTVQQRRPRGRPAMMPQDTIVASPAPAAPTTPQQAPAERPPTATPSAPPETTVRRKPTDDKPRKPEDKSNPARAGVLTRALRHRREEAPSGAFAALHGVYTTIWLTAPPPAPTYDAPRRAEIFGLLEKGVFEPVLRDQVPPNTRIFNGRFVDEIKHAGTAQAVEKSRFVVQAHSDDGKSTVLTESPTIQRMSQRVLLCVAASKMASGCHLLLRDISQAYVQATSNLRREFFVNPHKAAREILALPDEAILRIKKPLYGVPEAGNHWFATYTKHHTDALGMHPSPYDACLMVRRDDAFGVVAMQTDDTLILADDSFATAEEDGLKTAGFLAKPRETLTATTPLKFNGGVLSLAHDGSLSLSQESQVGNISLVSREAKVNKGTRGRISDLLDTKQQYVAQRARGAYVASVCQPEAAYDLSAAAQHSDPGEKEVNALNERLQWQMEHPMRGLRFVRLDEESLQVVAFTDAAFANNHDLSSQIGIVVVIRDATGAANTVHWSSIKCRRVTKSVLAAELYALVHGFDLASCIKATMDDIYDRQIPLVICTDSKSIFDAVTRLGTTSEKRLMIDLAMIRQAYERREVAEIKWIAGDKNPADAMTKSKKACDALTRLIDTNHIDLEEEGWVERT